MIPARMGLLVMLSDMPVACLDAGCRDHGDDRRRANGQDQKPDRRRAHENLPEFSSLSEIKHAPTRVACRVNLTLLAAPAQPMGAKPTGLMLRLRLLLLPLLLLGVMTPVEAAGGSSQHPMMPGIVSGDAAHHRALDAAFGLGAIGRNDKGGGDEQNGNDLHGGNPS